MIHPVSHKIYDLENCKSYTTDKIKPAFMMRCSGFTFLFGIQYSLLAPCACRWSTFERF